MRLALVVAIACAAIACEQRPSEPRPASRPLRSAETALAPVASTIASGPVTRAGERVVFEEKAMGTRVTLASFTTASFGRDAVEAKLRKAHQEIVRLEELMTTWRESSEVSRVNAAAGKGAVTVGPETFEVIEKSLWAGKISGGLFDITFDAMKGVWKFDEGAEARIPDTSAVNAARKLIDYRKIEIDGEARTVRLSTAGMRINLGGIAKGYAVDRAARLLEREGLNAYFVQAGGDLYVRGRKPDGQAFRVGVRDPRSRDPNDYFALIDVTDHSFSTAGDYERSFVKKGKRYHHIIDPRTGFPGTRARSVTVWADDAFTADAIDDAVFLMGPEEGLALVESLPGVGAIVVDANNKVWISKRLEGKVQVLKKPTDGI